MASWKKVLVSGSNIEVAQIKVDNLATNEVVIGGGQSGVLSTRAINGSGNIVATSGATGVSFTGSFTGSFKGDGSGLSGIAASFPTNEKTDLSSTDQFFISDGASKFITYLNLLNDLSGTNLAVEGSDSLTLATTISGLISLASTNITGSIFTGSRFIATNGFTGSHQGDGSGLTGLTATASLLNSSAITNAADNRIVTANGSAPTTLNGEANLTFDGTSLNLTGAFTSSGTISVNGSSILTNQTTFNIVNTTATTVNIAGGASTAVNIGNASGLTTIAGDLRVSGNDIQSSTGAVVLGFTGSSVNMPGNLTVGGDLTVTGTTTFINTTNTSLKDQFLLLASGSTGLTDAGIVIQTAASGTGSAFYLEASSTGTPGRFAIASGVAPGATSVTADEYLVSAKIGQGSNPSANPTWGDTNGTGNMWITTAGDIFIYS